MQGTCRVFVASSRVLDSSRQTVACKVFCDLHTEILPSLRFQQVLASLVQNGARLVLQEAIPFEFRQTSCNVDQLYGPCGFEPVVGETVVQKTVELDIVEIAARKVEEVGRLR